MKLKPIKNLHEIETRVCAHCEHFYYEDGGFGWNCKRSTLTIDGDYSLPYGSTDASDGYQYQFTCDRWTKNKQ